MFLSQTLNETVATLSLMGTYQREHHNRNKTIDVDRLLYVTGGSILRRGSHPRDCILLLDLGSKGQIAAHLPALRRRVRHFQSGYAGSPLQETSEESEEESPDSEKTV